MAYEKLTWRNLPDRATPLSAERLSHMETQYDEAVQKSKEEALSVVNPGQVTLFQPPGVGERFKTWDPVKCLYNGESPVIREAVSRISSARRGGQPVSIAVAGMSKVEGVGAGTGKWAEDSFPGQLTDLTGSRTGVVLASTRSGQWQFSGGATMSPNLSHNWMSPSTGAFSLTFQSSTPFTGFRVFAYRASAGQSLSVSVDGVPGEVFEVPGGSSWKSKTYSGFNDGTHQVEISGSASGFIIPMIELIHETGVTISNFGRGSSSAANWLPSGTTSEWSQLYATAFSTTVGSSEAPRPDIALIQTGLNGSSLSDIRSFISNVSEIEGPKVLPIIIAFGGVGGPEDSSIVPQRSTMYDLADELDIPLIDFTSLIGWNAEAASRGLVLDGVHEGRGGYLLEASLIARNLFY